MTLKQRVWSLNISNHVRLWKLWQWIITDMRMLLDIKLNCRVNLVWNCVHSFIPPEKEGTQRVWLSKDTWVCQNSRVQGYLISKNDRKNSGGYRIGPEFFSRKSGNHPVICTGSIPVTASVVRHGYTTYVIRCRKYWLRKITRSVHT